MSHGQVIKRPWDKIKKKNESFFKERQVYLDRRERVNWRPRGLLGKLAYGWNMNF